VLIAVVPAAGHALRLGPQPVSKEVLPVLGRPVMDHLVEQLLLAGPDELRVVTRPEKADVTAHARALGAQVVHGYPADVTASLGLGLAGLADDDEVLFGFPDTVFEPPDAFVQVLAALRTGADVALGLFRIPPADLPRSDVVVLADDGRVLRIEVKPAVPPSDLVWGVAATRAGVLRAVPPAPSRARTSTGWPAAAPAWWASRCPAAGSTSGSPTPWRARCAASCSTPDRSAAVVTGR
jgi:dTDP-glucose pyrophosphorylase